MSGEARMPQADLLVELAEKMFTMGISSEGDAFAVSEERPGVALLMRGGRESFRRDLAAAFHRNHRRVPSSTALTDALTVLESNATDATPRGVFLRVGWAGTKIVIDLADTAGSVIVIDEQGWQVTTRSPVLFRHTALTSPLPTPTAGVGLDFTALWSVTNIAPKSRPLVLAWLVANLLNVSHPILALLGLQGSGKSTSARCLANLMDASPAPLRAMPRDLEGWGVAASGSYVVPLDNVSSLADWLADALCRCATGEGILRRKLYSDSDLAVLTFLRPVIITSIDTGAMRGDLGDRLVVVDHDPIVTRRTDRELSERWAATHPEILGALCDLAVHVVQVLPTLKVPNLPRMADYGRVLAAVDKILVTDGMDSYRRQGSRIAEEVVEADDVALALRAIGDFDGTMGELLNVLNDHLDLTGRKRRPRDWPSTPRALRGRLNRALPALRSTGTSITIGRTSKGSHVTITQIEGADDGKDRHNVHDVHSADVGSDGCVGDDVHSRDLSADELDDYELFK